VIKLKKISILDDNMQECVELKVLPEQEDFVMPNEFSLAEAYDVNKAHDENGVGNIAVPYAIYENDKMVGFIMYGYLMPEDSDEALSRDEHVYLIWRILIDKNHQRKGIGGEALRLVMEEIKTKPCGEAKYCYSSYVPENIGSKTTFTSYGYEEDGRVLGGEVITRYKL
jgi:diamine N-acetyltransferase